MIVNALKRICICASGGMVDALASGASVLRDVEVQVLSRVPIKIEAAMPLFLLAIDYITENILKKDRNLKSNLKRVGGV